MNSTGTWHVPDAELARYAAGTADAVRGRFEFASIEAHLLACEHCRTALANARNRSARVSTAPDMWERIAYRIDEPRRPVRASTSLLHVSVASPPLIGATLGLAVLLLTAVCIAAIADPRWAAPVLLAFAPLAPVAGAVLGYQPRVDPAGSLAAATPLASGRLPMLRAVVAACVALIAGGIATLVVPLPGTALVLWLLPGVAFTAIVLAVGTWAEPSRAGFVLATFWMAIVLTWTSRFRRTQLDAGLSRLITDEQVVQVVCLGVIIIAGLICHRRRDALPNWRTR